MKNFKTIALSMLCVVLIYIIHDQRQQIDVYKVQNIDSLQIELFQAQNNIGRYEIALELLSQEDTLAAQKFDSIYKNETE